MTAPTIRDLSKQAALAARSLALAETEVKNNLLATLAQGLEQSRSMIQAANEIDAAEAESGGLSPHLIDRLSLNESRLTELTLAVDRVRTLPDPVGEISDQKTLPDGLMVSRQRIPLGLIAFICEARPGALVEAAALTMKSGNGLIVKCGKEMHRTAVALQTVLAEALTACNLPPAAVTVLPTLDRNELREMLTLADLIDLVIPRGGEGLIRFVSENSRIPVLKHFKGVCHLYVDQGADLKQALKLLINGKTQRPSTCNSLEALLVHKDEAEAFLPQAVAQLTAQGVAIKADPQALKYCPDAQPADQEDWGREFLDLTLAVKVVPDFADALDHIANYGSNHTEVIATCDPKRAEHFQRAVEASCVMVNASSRLNDGGCLGLGAEIGISTTRLHAYGPMGLRELTTTKFLVKGEGHLRR